MIKKNITNLLEAEMDRKDFLKLIALGALAATGIAQVLKAVSQQAPKQHIAPKVASNYGGSIYGGYGGSAKK